MASRAVVGPRATSVAKSFASRVESPHAMRVWTISGVSRSMPGVTGPSSATGAAGAWVGAVVRELLLRSLRFPRITALPQGDRTPEEVSEEIGDLLRSDVVRQRFSPARSSHVLWLSSLPPGRIRPNTHDYVLIRSAAGLPIVSENPPFVRRVARARGGGSLETGAPARPPSHGPEGRYGDQHHDPQDEGARVRAA